MAEELECDWDKVRLELVQPAANGSCQGVWRDLSTGGSRAIRGSQEFVRRGGATARAMLVQAAADGWRVDPAHCSVGKGVITHAASGRRTSYGAAASAAGQRSVGMNRPARIGVYRPAWSRVMAKAQTVARAHRGLEGGSSQSCSPACRGN